MSNKDVKKAMIHENVLGAGAEKRKHLNAHDTFHAVMGEYRKGTLHSGSGEITKNRKQAIAIAISESKGKE